MTKSVILAIGVLICTATTARAQIVGCGDVKTTNDIYQIDSRKAVALQANTTRSVSPCPMVVQPLSVRVRVWRRPWSSV